MSALLLQLILDALGQGFYSFTSSRTVGDPVGGGLNLGIAVHASLGALNVVLELKKILDPAMFSFSFGLLVARLKDPR